MAISGKYGRLNIPKIDADEPVFILRAQDMLAKTAIEIYQLLAASHTCCLAKNLDKEIKAFKKWQGHKKMPD